MGSSLPGQSNDYKTGICCFSAKHAALKNTTGWLGIKIMCLSEATCLPTDLFHSCEINSTIQ